MESVETRPITPQVAQSARREPEFSGWTGFAGLLFFVAAGFTIAGLAWTFSSAVSASPDGLTRAIEPGVALQGVALILAGVVAAAAGTASVILGRIAPRVIGYRRPDQPDVPVVGEARP